MMRTGLFVPRFLDDPDLGLPAGENFLITGKHTRYEWSMALADVHPYTPCLAHLILNRSGYGLRELQKKMVIRAAWERLKPRVAKQAPASPVPSARRSLPGWESAVLRAETASGMETRTIALQYFRPKVWEIYRALEVVPPLRRAWCVDRPEVEDLTRAVIAVGDVIESVRRRGDRGVLIDKLLVRRSSREKPFWDEARTAAFQWLDEEGCPAPGDGHQADRERHMAEWLNARGHQVGESTIRRHVGRWIAERRTELGMTNGAR